MTNNDIYNEKLKRLLENKYLHTAGDRTPYTYLIGWSKYDVWYYNSIYFPINNSIKST